MLFLSTVILRLSRLPPGEEDWPHDVCALPSGISVPHMFVTFVIMLRGDAADPRQDQLIRDGQAWEAGLTWVFMQSFVLMAGGFIAPIYPERSPRGPRLLGSLAGDLDHLHLDAARPLLIFEHAGDR